MSEEKKPCPLCGEQYGEKECCFMSEELYDLRARIAELEKRAVKILYPPFEASALPTVGQAVMVYEIDQRVPAGGIVRAIDDRFIQISSAHTQAGWTKLKNIRSIVLLPDLTANPQTETPHPERME